MTTIITARGIGEELERNMLSQLVRNLPSWEHIELGWSASYGFVNPGKRWDGQSFERALAAGQRMLTDVIERHLAVDPTPRIVVAGYSGGAALVHRWLAANWASYPEVKGAVLVADPHAPLTNGLFGVAGLRPMKTFGPVLWVSNPRDMICCCPPDSPIRTIGDQTAMMSFCDPAAWGLDLLDRVRNNRWQQIRTNPLDAIGTIRRFGRAVDDVCGYLGVDPRTLKFSGSLCQHTVYSWQRPTEGDTWLQNAAKRIRSVG